MNHQGVSEICFEEVYVVPADQTACRLFAHMPHSSEFASFLVDALATGYLIAIIESVCIREMRYHIDLDRETVVGSAVDLEHFAPVPVGARLVLRGWTERIGERDATLRFRVEDAHDVVSEGTLKFVAVDRDAIAGRIARKAGTTAHSRAAMGVV